MSFLIPQSAGCYFPTTCRNLLIKFDQDYENRGLGGGFARPSFSFRSADEIFKSFFGDMDDFGMGSRTGRGRNSDPFSMGFGRSSMFSNFFDDDEDFFGGSFGGSTMSKMTSNFGRFGGSGSMSGTTQFYSSSSYTNANGQTITESKSTTRTLDSNGNIQARK